MWIALARDGGLAAALLTFLAWVLSVILEPLVTFAMSGPHADAPSVQRIGGYFGALSLRNLTLIFLLAVGIHVLGRAASESGVTR